ncbi:MAG TPA: sugar MFS transporter [Acidobacteriaceae bacterium]|jgi:FHS family L-fucose permease-like MFS transporter
MNVRNAYALVATLFLTWGLLNAVNDVLVAHLRAAFHLSYHAATLVQLTFYLTCFFASFPSSRLVARLGYRLVMLTGLAIMALGAFSFVLASEVATFASFLFAQIVMASGSTALQTAAGPYVALLGSEESASSRFSLALGVNSFGAMLAPGFGAWLILRSGVEQAGSLKLPYLGVAFGLIFLAFVVGRSRLPDITAQTAPTGSDRQPLGRLRQHPKLLFGVAAMFLYVGAEIAIGSLLIPYLGQPDTLSLPRPRAALLVSFYGGGMMVGRFIGFAILDRLRPTLALAIVATAATALVLTSVVTTGGLAAYSMLAVGLCNSIMVPVIFTTAISGLGPLTAKGSGLLVAALVGGALIPFLQGSLADRIGLHYSFLVPSVCYVFIALYGFWCMRSSANHARQEHAV